ncbi:hypothetical protein FDUTEX481_08368, partial [Tolypothrix sp. PCC 7601]
GREVFVQRPPYIAFEVKLIPMGSAVPLREIYMYQGFSEMVLRVNQKVFPKERSLQF